MPGLEAKFASGREGSSEKWKVEMILRTPYYYHHCPDIVLTITMFPSGSYEPGPLMPQFCPRGKYQLPVGYPHGLKQKRPEPKTKEEDVMQQLPPCSGHLQGKLMALG